MWWSEENNLIKLLSKKEWMTWDHPPLIWNSPVHSWCSSYTMPQLHFYKVKAFHRQWQSFKVKWKSIPTISRRVVMFWGRGNPVTSHPFLRVNSQLVLLSVVVSFTPLINPHILLYWFLREEGRVRKRNIDWLIHARSSTRDWAHNLGIKPPPFGVHNDAPTNRATLARASDFSYHLLLGSLPLRYLLHEESSQV